MLMSSTDRHPFSDCLTHRVCREAETNLSKSKIALKRFSNGIRAWDRSTKVFIENVGSWLTMKDRLLKGARPEFEEGSVQQVEGDTGVEGVRVQGSAWGQSSRCLRGPTRERWERRASGGP